MAVSRFHAALREQITDHMKGHIDGLIAGRISDYSAYRECVGYLRGLNAALELAAEIEKSLYE